MRLKIKNKYFCINVYITKGIIEIGNWDKIIFYVKIVFLFKLEYERNQEFLF